MIQTRLRTLAAAMLLSAGVTATLAGHHSFAAYYFEDQMIDYEGVVSQVEFKAPHVWLHVTTRESGKERTYSAEWSNPTRLERDGITKDTLKIDDVVHVWGSPSRNASDNRVHLKRIQRPSDGWQWNGRREVR
jgi:Family of unknown function (DUF6152)